MGIISSAGINQSVEQMENLTYRETLRKNEGIITSFSGSMSLFTTFNFMSVHPIVVRIFQQLIDQLALLKIPQFTVYGVNLIYGKKFSDTILGPQNRANKFP